MKSLKNRLNKITACLAAGLFSLAVVLVPASRAEAVDAWGVAAQALGVYAAYQSALSNILALGNDVSAQIQSRRQDLEENGLDKNDNDVQLINGIMEQLIAQGDYALKVNSLPFIWAVNDSRYFNAACYPTNYISVNRGLVRGLKGEEDELAAVLAHEMTHGLEQHSAKNYAQAMAQAIGMSFMNMDTGSMDWNRLAALTNYSIARNVTLPTEHEADEGGFYLMASAGFNPGGPAAAMYRMGYYLTFETENFLEYQDLDPHQINDDNYSDHPDTEAREQRMAQLMTDYSAGHVAVHNREDVYIDGRKLLSVQWTRYDYDNTADNAYYVAGALAKAFHDYDSAYEWDFRPEGEGVTCLPDTRVNETLHEFLRRTNTGALLRQLVEEAYAQEEASGARKAMRAREFELQLAVYEAKQKALDANDKDVKKMRENADSYSDYGEGALALRQSARVFASHNHNNLAESYGVRGRARAVLGDYEGGLSDANEAVRLDSSNINNLLNRADVERMMGDNAAALADCEQAKGIDARNPLPYWLAAEIQDVLGNKEQALAEYKAFYKLRPKSFRGIPKEYLQDISEEDYKELLKEEEKEKKAREEKAKEEKK